MKIVVINGSPKGKTGNTNVMVEAFLKGAKEAGAETLNIFLAEKEIAHCKGCHTCWTKGPGQCVTQDDMLGILGVLGGADVIVFATPIYFENISGMLKVFMDRMTMIGSPHSQTNAQAENKQADSTGVEGPRLMMIASCGYADSSEFDVTSLWINRVAQQMRMELIGEIYAGQGKYLTSLPKELTPVLDNYKQILEEAGKEISVTRIMSEATLERLMQTRNGIINTTI